MRKELFGFYEIDSEGFVFSTKAKKEIHGRLDSKDNFVKINLMVNGKKKTFYLHKLMVTAFLPIYEPSIHGIKFLDGNRRNCNLNNLSLTTKKTFENGLKVVYVNPIIVNEVKQ